MAVKKSQLYSTLWKGADDLRGGMDASQYKDYILTLLFVKYVSDKYLGEPYAPITVPEGGSFQDMVALKGSAEIGDGLNKVIGKLAQENNLKGVIDVADFNDEDKLGKGKDMVDKLSSLVGLFEEEELNFSKNRSQDDDILGDAYEYLMREFATQSGKSKGQFYTPAEVSRILAKVIDIDKASSQSETLYDPTCGSGSLLLKAADEAPEGVTIYGQEMDNATAALAKMNMILHNNPTAEIWQDNTLSRPHWTEGPGRLKRFDYIVANPPFSYKKWTNGLDPENDEFNRFQGYGIPPKKNGDYAFLLHMVASLKSDGKAAVILPHGVLFRGNSEEKIRTNLLKKGYIKGIIGLPANLFYGTGIPASIIVLDKENANNRDSIFMIDASKGFVKDGNKNRLREQDIHKIVDVFNNQIEIEKYSRRVPLSEIEEKEYNLNIPRYIDTQEPEDIQDIEAHLKGGIPKNDIDDLKKYWQVYSTLRDVLFDDLREGYLELAIEANEVKQVIYSHDEFKIFRDTTVNVFTEWKVDNKPKLVSINEETQPKELIKAIAEDLLRRFADLDLIDKYDMYQHLMAYWNETMQDDVYLIAANGWKPMVEPILTKKGKKKGWESPLIPKGLVINRYFFDEQQAIKELETQLAEAEQKKEELESEHTGEDGTLEEAKSDAGNVTLGEVRSLIREYEADEGYEVELKVLNEYLDLNNKEKKIKKQIREGEKKLDKKLLEQYKSLTEDEVRALVIDDKWMTKLEAEVQNELERLSQQLAQRINELFVRYDTPLPQIEQQLEELTNKVGNHIEKMGFEF